MFNLPKTAVADASANSGCLVVGIFLVSSKLSYLIYRLWGFDHPVAEPA